MIRIKLMRLLSKIIIKICPIASITRRINDYYHHLISLKLRPYFVKAINVSDAKISSNKHVKNSGIIWIFWWQGKDKMPTIVKKCYESILKYSMDHKVILVTKYNVHKYAKLPSYIYKKVHNNEITLTHFSDILRFNLLLNYGGLWLDSTVYCNAPLTSKYFGRFYTISTANDDVKHQFVSNSKWTGFIIGGRKYNKIFKFMNNFFLIYWKQHKQMISYFLIDYALKYVYENNVGDFRKYDDTIAKGNDPHLYGLVHCMNQPYNQDLYDEISKETNLYKLTYKKNFNNNKGTFFYKLLNNEL